MKIKYKYNTNINTKCIELCCTPLTAIFPLAILFILMDQSFFKNTFSPSTPMGDTANSHD